MFKSDPPNLISLLEEIENLREGCRLLEEIRSQLGHYELRDLLEKSYDYLGKDLKRARLYGTDGLNTRLDRYFKFDDSE